MSPTPTARQIVRAATMLHPELHRYAKRPAVRRAIAEYRAAWRSHDGTATGGQRVKDAEAALNRAVENAIAPTETKR